MTTRKLATLPAIAVALLLLDASCTSPGTLHVYSLAAGSPTTLRDTGADTSSEVPSFIAPNESLTGFAYDPFTDHFFLRLAPGNVIRVVDRPARAIKRKFRVGELSAGGGGNLTIRPRDGHVFALEPAARDVVEFTRFGEFVRRIKPEGLMAEPAGIAYDAARDRLFLLTGGRPAQITTHSLDGGLRATVEPDREIAPGSLAYDSDKKEFYAPLAKDAAIGVFGEDGRLHGMIHVLVTFVAVGPRSFLRMF